MKKQMKVSRRWTALNVKELCIRHGLYTNGTNTEYEEMLRSVRFFEPTYENMLTVAEDIAAHSDEADLSYILFLLEQEAVRTFFEFEE